MGILSRLRGIRVFTSLKTGDIDAGTSTIGAGEIAANAIGGSNIKGNTIAGSQLVGGIAGSQLSGGIAGSQLSGAIAGSQLSGGIIGSQLSGGIVGSQITSVNGTSVVNTSLTSAKISAAGGTSICDGTAQVTIAHGLGIIPKVVSMLPNGSFFPIIVSVDTTNIIYNTSGSTTVTWYAF